MSGDEFDVGGEYPGPEDVHGYVAFVTDRLAPFLIVGVIIAALIVFGITVGSSHA